MKKRILSLLFVTIAGATLVAAGPARAASDDNTFPSYRDPISLGDLRQLPSEEAGPSTLSFHFANLYNRILETAARLADATYFDLERTSTFGFNVSFQSIEDSDYASPLELETTERLLPESQDEFESGFSMRINMSDDGATLVDPSPRKPGAPLKDHIYLSLGARYDHSEHLSVDVGYEHLLVNETSFDRPSGFGNDIMGDYATEMGLIGARLRWAFE